MRKGEYKKLHGEKFHNMYSSPNIVRYRLFLFFHNFSCVPLPHRVVLPTQNLCIHRNSPTVQRPCTSETSATILISTRYVYKHPRAELISIVNNCESLKPGTSNFCLHDHAIQMAKPGLTIFKSCPLSRP